MFDVALHRESRRMAVSGGELMSDQLLPYYERELKFIRQMAAEFAEKYPKVAGRLLLQPDTCEDPHVERLIEAFALLAGRVHHKLDDEFPEITEALLDVLYPHYLRPVPPTGHRPVSARSVAKRPGIHPRDIRYAHPQQAGKWQRLLLPHLLSRHPLAPAGDRRLRVPRESFRACPACPRTRPP